MKEKIEHAAELMKELQKAKSAVKHCLDHADGRVDMYGLVYWAEQVEYLRKEIKSLL